MLMSYQDCIYVLEGFGFYVNGVDGERFRRGFQEYSSVAVEPHEEYVVFLRRFLDGQSLDSSRNTMQGAF